jgi:SAM-dependent methyltransferase
MPDMPEFHPAFRTWNDAAESLESIERRIHDGVPLAKLHERASGYVNTMYDLFPRTEPRATDIVCEIGSGLGYIMEALQKRCQPRLIVGLDVAPAMVRHAADRFTRDAIDSTRLQLQAYDGVRMPFKDQSIDHIYSVACLQHVPKLYVYHLFGEILRVLKNGYAVLQFLSFAQSPVQNRVGWNFRHEIERQLEGRPGHWHHFYATEELTAVLRDGYGASAVTVKELRGTVWAIFRR